MSTGWSQKQVPCAPHPQSCEAFICSVAAGTAGTILCVPGATISDGSSVCQFYFPHHPQEPLKKPNPLPQPREQQRRLRGCSRRSWGQLQVCRRSLRRKGQQHHTPDKTVLLSGKQVSAFGGAARSDCTQDQGYSSDLKDTYK